MKIVLNTSMEYQDTSHVSSSKRIHTRSGDALKARLRAVENIKKKYFNIRKMREEQYYFLEAIVISLRQ